MSDTYTNKDKKDYEECFKYIGLKNPQLEFQIKNNINKCYENILTNYMNDILEKEKSLIPLEEKSKKSLISYIKDIIKHINPSFKDFKDSMNINEYIKVKIVKHTDFSHSRVIDGFAMRKNVCSKKMGERKEDPKILLLNFDLGNLSIYDPLENNKKSHDIEEIKKQIELLNVNVILIRKGINNNLLDYLKNNNIIAVVNVKTSALYKISRCTKGKMFSSLNELCSDVEKNNSNICGCCKLFRVDKSNKSLKDDIKNNNIFINDLMSCNCKNFANIVTANDYSLMSFEGCDSILYQTLILSGPDHYSLKNLKKLLISEVFTTAREFYLQKCVLYFLFCNIPKAVKDESSNSLPFRNKIKSSTNRILKIKNINNIKILNNNLNNNNNINVPNPPIILSKIRSQNNDTMENILKNEKSVSPSAAFAKVESNENDIIARKHSVMNFQYKFLLSPKKYNNNNNSSKNNSNSNISSNEFLKNKDSISSSNINNNLFQTPQPTKFNNTPEFDKIPKLTDKIGVDFNVEKNNTDFNKVLGHSKQLSNDLIDNIRRTSTIKYNYKSTPDILLIKKNTFEYGFDTTPIKTNNTPLHLVKLRMCKSSKITNINNNNNNQTTQNENNNNSINEKTELKSPEILKKKPKNIFDYESMDCVSSSEDNNNQKDINRRKSKMANNETENLNELNENTILKSINFVCGEPQDLHLIYYDSLFGNNENERDKPLGKLIIDMISEKDNKCIKCKNPMSNHFYFLYDSTLSRIKIEFIINNSDSNLDKIIDYLNKDVNESKKNTFFETIQNPQIDYSMDIYCYGFCKICKQIVTPLIRVPKNFYNYSSAKFFKTIFYNDKIFNRGNEENFNLTTFSTPIADNKCNHSSFHSINRIFVTKYGALKFQYENCTKYNLLSVQKILDKTDEITEEKTVDFNNECDCIKIMELLLKNFILAHQEILNLGKIIQNNNINNDLISNIIDSSIRLIVKIIGFISEKDYHKEKEDNNSSSTSNLKEEPQSAKNTKEFKEIEELKISDTISNIEKNDSINTTDKIVTAKNSNTNTVNFNDRSISELRDEDNFSMNSVISNIFKQNFDKYTKKVSITKKLFYRIAQFKIICNKIRNIIYKTKILILLDLILKDEETLKKNNSLNKNKEKEKPTDLNKCYTINEVDELEQKKINDNAAKKPELKPKTPKIITKKPPLKIKENNNVEIEENKFNINRLDISNNADNIFNNEFHNSNIDNDDNNENIFYNEINKQSKLTKKASVEFKCPFELNPKIEKLREEENINNRKISNITINDNKNNRISIISNNIIENSNKINESKEVNSTATNTKIITNEDSISTKLNENTDDNPNNLEEKKFYDPQNILKLLVEKYANLFDDNIKYDELNSKDLFYSKMLSQIKFYDEYHNDFSSLISENDLSSIISYAISSNEYKAFIKDKSKILEIKKTQQFNNLNQNNYDKRREKDRNKYDSLLLFDNSKINYEVLNTEIDKKTPTQLLTNENISLLTDEKNQSQSDQKKNCQQLEAELLSDDKEHFQMTIKSITPNKFKSKLQSRKVTLSRQTMGNILTSPRTPSPLINNNSNVSQEKSAYKKIEANLETIEYNICDFFDDIAAINRTIKKVKSKNKFEKLLKSLNFSDNLLNTIINNFNSDYFNNMNINDNYLKTKMLNTLSIFKSSLSSFLNLKSYNLTDVRRQIIKGNPKSDEINLMPNNSIKNETNLIDAIGKLYFYENFLNRVEIDIKIYFPRQFEALRIAYGCAYDDLLLSIINSNTWADVSGGKSKASFYRTKDKKYLFKSIGKNELNMFIEIAFSYFYHVDKYLFHKMPSLLLKFLGVYKIQVKKLNGNKIISTDNYYLMLMENLNYGLNLEKDNIISYDLKGSLINRYISKKKKKEKDNVVLLDTNFKEDFNGEPLILDKEMYRLLLLSVHNDTLFLSKMDVVDYSLLLIVIDDNEECGEGHKLIRVGIIDYIRKYTWDKQVEHIVKTIIHGFNSPTIVSPGDYKERFNSAVKSYFIGV